MNSLTQFFGWAGLLMEAPANFRLLKIEGAADHGRFILGDEHRARLQVNWGSALTRRFKPEPFVLRRAAGKSHKEARPVEHPHFSPAARCDDVEAGISRWVGFCAATRRAVEVTWWVGQTPENLLFEKTVLPGLCDQSPEQPQRWAVYDFRFTAPQGFRYAESELSLGDMRIALEGPRRRQITVRQIYPAKLALSRMGLEDWMAATAKSADAQYPVPSRKNFHKTADGVACEAKLRLGLAATLWRAPRRLHWHLIHDSVRDRLMLLGVAAPPERVEHLFAELRQGLHW